MHSNQKKEELYDLLEVEASELEDYIKDLWEFNPIPMAYINPIGIIMDADKSMASLLGIDREDIIGSRLEDYVPEKKDITSIAQETLTNGLVKNKEITIKTKKNQETPINISTLVRKDAEENVVGYFISLTDMCERKRVETALRESEELYKTLVRTSPDAVTVSDLEGRITHASQRSLELYNAKSQEELTGKNAFELIAPEDREKAALNMQRVLKKGFIRNVEYSFLRSDGSRYPGELSAAMIKDSSGKPKAFIATTRDISERKEAGKALKEKYAELEEFHDLAVGRELKMIELENEVNALLIELGRKPKYKEEPS
ncbi:MAG: PAS domain S-box protein [Candidatus Margulisbacteria bacterium]|nr:PAS domain S-box protein [Candidatus Margulisiibacteriota bacterium]